MSESLPSTQTPSVPLAYQPISGWAIAGFTIGCLFTLLVAICAIVGLFQGAPVFFPTWVASFAILGIALSLLGQRQVQNSEGTRAGAKLARIGMWLSLVSGLTYFSYFFFTGEALKGQANAFLMEKGDDFSGFFPRIREGGDNPIELDNAFLFTLPPASRTGRAGDPLSMRKGHDMPSKESQLGSLTQFREGLFVRPLYKHLGKDAEITPMAVLEWKYEKRSYKVYRIYHIKTKEIEMNVLLAVFSVEPETSGQGRKWFVNLAESGPIREGKNLTQLGEGIQRLRKHANEWFHLRFRMLNEESSLGDINLTDKTDWNELLLPEGKEDPRKLVYQALSPGTGSRAQKLQIYTQPDDPGKWELTSEGKIRIDQLFTFEVPGSPARSPLHVEGVVTLETSRLIDPAKFEVGAPRPDWNVVRFVFTTVRPTVMPGPKG